MIADNIKAIQKEIGNAKLVVVSKYRSIEELKEVYNAGIRDMGENRVQHLMDRYEALPKDINWHMIGHLQTNKVKYIAPFISLIHSVDSYKLLKEIAKQAARFDRKIPVLLQVHLGDEESKFGMNKEEIDEILEKSAQENLNKHIDIQGIMGMATHTENMDKVKREFSHLKTVFDITRSKCADWPNFNTLSMGMSGDYQVAILEGSTMIRVGSAIFSTN